MPSEAELNRLFAALQASPTGRQLLAALFVLPTATADPASRTDAADGETVAWTSGGLAYHSTYYAALGAWKKVQMT